MLTCQMHAPTLIDYDLQTLCVTLNPTIVFANYLTNQGVAMTKGHVMLLQADSIVQSKHLIKKKNE